MSFLRHIMEKPWIAESVLAERSSHAAAPARSTNADLGLNFFIAVVSVLFFMLLVAYAGRMAFEDWRPAPAPGLLWQNTIFLILASAAMEWARLSATREQLNGVKLGMIGAGICTAAFVTGQILAWRQLNAMEFFEVTNPAIAFFYMITGLHVLHLLGGLAAWGRVMDRLWREPDASSIARSVQLCARYWHFLLIVWLVLFGLLFSGNDNLNILLTICGIR
jgi:cytochrome c oxidase subunit 3